ncbi:MAG: HD domain-containing protein [Candidatus Gastranaerophilales bacterium]|nr:HD domain-containing protein [Candidatus Gastranaerophilales bacterium]
MTDEEKGASLFGRSIDLVEGDPLEEIFALNLGDFISENLISEDLAKKIGSSEKNKTAKLKNQLSELVSVYSMNNTLSVIGFSSKDDYIIYNSIAKTMTQILENDACHVYLTKEFACGLNNVEKDIVLAGSSLDFNKDVFSENIGFDLTEDEPVVQALKNIQTISVSTDKLPQVKTFKQLNEDKIKQYIAVPMHNNANVVGIFVFENYSEKNIRKEFMTLVEAMSRLFGTSISLQKIINTVNELIDSPEAEMFELQHMRAELTALIGDLGDNQEAFIKSLATAVDIKGQYSVAHSQNTANLARKLCTELGLNEKTKDLIYYAGLLQNIGKITLPEELFSNKGKLSKEDWDKLKNYANIGVNILMKINFLSEVVPYICYHKERYDGSGEPEGLARMSIPLGSRIIAVADAYSAMTSDRAHRTAMTREQALTIMKQEAGIKWDPIIVDALYDVVNE